MEQKMFCFQCEQTAGCKGCTGNSGVCGKQAGIAEMQDQLTGKLIGLARTIDGNGHLISHAANQVVREGLFATITNVNFDKEALSALLRRVDEVKRQIVPLCYECTSACGKNDDYDMEHLWTAGEDIRSLKSLILFGIRGMAAYAYHAAVLGYTDPEVDRFFIRPSLLSVWRTGGWMNFFLLSWKSGRLT